MQFSFDVRLGERREPPLRPRESLGATIEGDRIPRSAVSIKTRNSEMKGNAARLGWFAAGLVCLLALGWVLTGSAGTPVLPGLPMDWTHRHVIFSQPATLEQAAHLADDAIATPVHTHYDLALQALKVGKHVLVEKPMTSTSEQALQFIEEAERRNLTLMVDQTFVYTGAVRKIRELTTSGILGEIYYYDSTRVNLGLFQRDVDVIGTGRT